jgi:hypothetical protein
MWEAIIIIEHYKKKAFRLRGYWKLKDEALDLTVWTTHFGKGYRPVVRNTTK